MNVMFNHQSNGCNVWTCHQPIRLGAEAPGVEAPKEVSVFARVRRRVTIGSCFFFFRLLHVQNGCFEKALLQFFTCCNLFLDCLQAMESTWFCSVDFQRIKSNNGTSSSTECCCIHEASYIDCTDSCWGQGSSKSKTLRFLRLDFRY